MFTYFRFLFHEKNSQESIITLLIYSWKTERLKINNYFILTSRVTNRPDLHVKMVCLKLFFLVLKLFKLQILILFPKELR